MKELTWFYMKGCPYCAQAGRALEELKKENPSYENVSIHQIDENAEPETADKYDYYSVPSIFLGDEKLYEAHRGEGCEECKGHVKAALDKAMSE